MTSSLTKAYGVGGLHCGWALAEPDLARRMWRIKDLLDPAGVHVAERLSVIALQQLDHIASRAKALLSANRVLFDRFLRSRTDLEAVWPVSGTIVFPRLGTSDTATLVERLRNRYETDVVPGTYFGMGPSPGSRWTKGSHDRYHSWSPRKRLYPVTAASLCGGTCSCTPWRPGHRVAGRQLRH